MRAGLNNPGGVPIGHDLLTLLASLQIETLRCDVPNDGDLGPHVEPYLGSGIRPLFIIHRSDRHQPLADVALEQLGPDGYDLEIYNEPTGSRGPQTGPGDMVTFEDYLEGIFAIHHDARARGFLGAIYAGAPANIGPDWWGWLERTMLKTPPDVDLAFHRYSYKTQDDRLRPWPPFASRTEELESLVKIAGATRRIACTEFGYHTAPEQVGLMDAVKHGKLPYTVKLNDDEMLENLVADLRLYESGLVTDAYVYNINDGPQNVAGDRWGIRRMDGSFKPAARAFAEWRT
jgi:hypothetical protein